jgi:CubicO group peptidase (beta-lactamase class C family)
MISALFFVLSMTVADSTPGNLTAIDLQPPDTFSGQVVLGSRSDILFSGSFGMADRANEVPVTPDTLFDIGSLTKQITSAGVLLLAQEDQVSLDAPLSAFFEDVPSEFAGQSLHALLTHTAGLPLYSGGDYELADRDDFDAWLANAPVNETSPGAFHYSNPGYSLLARIIEMRSGMDYEVFIHERLLMPAGLDGVLGYRQLLPQLPEAAGYMENEAMGRPREQAWLSDGPSWNLRGNGGLLASADTLYRWTVALTGGEILDDEHTAMLFQPHVIRNADRDLSYGYGWNISHRDPIERIYHSGGNGVFVAYVEWQPVPDCFIAITSNAFDESGISALVDEAREALSRAAECSVQD